jgi:RNA polymerase sigma factor (sigma-70 family)
MLGGWSRELHLLAWHYAATAEEHDDLFQEAQIALWEAAMRAPAGPGSSFVAYARACLRNRMIDLRRAASRRLEVESLDEAGSVAGQPPCSASVERTRDVQQLLGTLDPYKRDILRQVVMGDRTRAAVAREMKVSREWIRQVVSSTLDQLRISAALLGIESMAA